MNIQAIRFLSAASKAYNKTAHNDKIKRDIDYHLYKLKNTPDHKKEQVLNDLRPRLHSLLNSESKNIIDNSAREHISELESEVAYLKSELAKYKNKKTQKSKKKKVVKINSKEIKKLKLEIIRLKKICELLERNNKTKKLEQMKQKLKKLEKKLKTIKQ